MELKENKIIDATGPSPMIYQKFEQGNSNIYILTTLKPREYTPGVEANLQISVSVNKRFLEKIDTLFSEDVLKEVIENHSRKIRRLFFKNIVIINISIKPLLEIKSGIEKLVVSKQVFLNEKILPEKTSKEEHLIDDFFKTLQTK